MLYRKILDGLTNQASNILDTHLCLGITGLSQSGKSTFITSFINQLLNFNKAQLSGFSPVAEERLLSVRLHPVRDKTLKAFAYEDNFRQLCEPNSAWPASSTGASGCLLELRLKSSKSFNPLKREFFSLFLEIRDYPGEWLLDLPLREMSFSRFSSQCAAQYTVEPRRSLLGELLHDLQQLDPLNECNHELLKSLHLRFKDFLRFSKKQTKNLSLIQPGRFLLPDDNPLINELYFVPLLKSHSYSEDQLAAASPTSYYKVCEQQYSRYIKELVEPFYKNFFSKLDRQLVLVDVVSALNSGPDYLTDMRQALTNILDSFNYGKQNALFQLINPKINKLAFAATKVDQVLSQDHSAVRELTTNILKHAYHKAAYKGIKPYCEAIAAVQAAVEIEHNKQRGIIGLNSQGEAIGYINPRIPIDLPTDAEWQDFSQWPILKLYPPKGINFMKDDALPHIRLDILLNYLLADKCQ